MSKRDPRENGALCGCTESEKCKCIYFFLLETYHSCHQVSAVLQGGFSCGLLVWKVCLPIIYRHLSRLRSALCMNHQDVFLKSKLEARSQAEIHGTVILQDGCLSSGYKTPLLRESQRNLKWCLHIWFSPMERHGESATAQSILYMYIHCTYILSKYSLLKCILYMHSFTQIILMVFLHAA